MKISNYKKILPFFLLLFFTACNKILDKNPLGTQTEANFFLDPNQAILAVNAVYDVASWDEGPGVGHNYEWMFGDLLSNDAEKGSTASDFPQMQDMKDWKADPNNNPSVALYTNVFQGIFRANTVIKNLGVATWDQTLKNRISGEAHFMRGYFYFYLLRVFGGMQLFSEPVKPSEFGKVDRASFSETAKFIEEDFKAAIATLPLKSGYAAADMGRVTKGAAQAYLARLLMYEIGTDNTNAHTWQEVYDLTKDVMNSGQYSLIANYAAIQETESENGPESIFEIQFKESSNNWGAIKVGTTNNLTQENKSTWGWGFNDPTQSLHDEFEPHDPRLASTMYKDGDIVLGEKQTIDYPNQNATGFLNRKAAILKPTEVKASGQNIRKMRYADLLLMNAEAAAHTGKEQDARDILNQIRARARASTQPKGSTEGNTTDYLAANVPSGTLPDIASSVFGQNLLNAIYHERRVELGMEAIHFWDMVRLGTYLPSLSSTVRAACESHCIKTNVVNPIPVLPLPLTEVQSWGITQNPNY